MVRNIPTPLTEAQQATVLDRQCALAYARGYGAPVTFQYVSADGERSQVTGTVGEFKGRQSTSSVLIASERGTRTYSLLRMSEPVMGGMIL